MGEGRVEIEWKLCGDGRGKAMEMDGKQQAMANLRKHKKKKEKLKTLKIYTFCKQTVRKIKFYAETNKKQPTQHKCKDIILKSQQNLSDKEYQKTCNVIDGLSN